MPQLGAGRLVERIEVRLAPPTNTRPPLVTIGPELPRVPNPAGSSTPRSSGCSRTSGLPSPNGTFHAISPAWRSIVATKCAYRGLMS
ncbi:MAG: hypothetical protein OXP69_11545 [Spirochaetaceae bacterium]|nr:hypothetical protein [Spirochaetaceae bacterium]